ncbi:MAG: LysR family transcriptional regulator substrate-binding protein [Arhodomonas sp.]|nr:LysR family transcriptional regulator substrate-binding protein [Arhodomonas sp.]
MPVTTIHWRRREGLSLAELARHPAVLPGSRTFTRGLVTDRFARRGLRPNVGLATNYLETLKMMAAIGLGWSVPAGDPDGRGCRGASGGRAAHRAPPSAISSTAGAPSPTRPGH